MYYLLPNVCLKFAELLANSVDPDETPRSAASHMGLPLFAQACLPKYVQ